MNRLRFAILSVVLFGCGDKSPPSSERPTLATAPATTPPLASSKPTLPVGIPDVLFLATGAQGVLTEFRLSKMNVHDGAITDVVRHLVDGTKQNGSFDSLLIDATHTKYVLGWLTSPGAEVPVLAGQGRGLTTGAFFVGDVARGIVEAVPVHRNVREGQASEIPVGFGASGEVYTRLSDPDREQLRGVDASNDWMLVDDPKVKAIGLSPDGKQVSIHDGKSFYIANVSPKGSIRVSSAKKLFTLPDGWSSRWDPVLTDRELVYIASDGSSAHLEMFDLATSETILIHDLTRELSTIGPILYNPARRTLLFGGGSGIAAANVYSFSFATRTKQRLDRATLLLDVSPDGRWLLEERDEQRFSIVDATTGQLVGEVPYTGAGMTGTPSVDHAYFIGT